MEVASHLLGCIYKAVTNQDRNHLLDAALALWHLRKEKAQVVSPKPEMDRDTLKLLKSSGIFEWLRKDC